MHPHPHGHDYHQSPSHSPSLDSLLEFDYRSTKYRIVTYLKVASGVTASRLRSLQRDGIHIDLKKQSRSSSSKPRSSSAKKPQFVPDPNPKRRRLPLMMASSSNVNASSIEGSMPSPSLPSPSQPPLKKSQQVKRTGKRKRKGYLSESSSDSLL